MQYPKQYKLALIGDTNVGKTSIVNYLTKKDETIVPTIGSGYSSYHMKINDENIKLNIWDTAGQEKYRSLIPMYYRGTDMCLIVFDINNYDVSNIEEWINVYIDNTGEHNIILVANKLDLVDELHYRYKNLDELASKYNYKLFKTSAINGTNINNLFEHVGYHLVNNILTYKHYYDPISIEHKNDKNDRCSVCCT